MAEFPTTKTASLIIGIVMKKILFNEAGPSVDFHPGSKFQVFSLSNSDRKFQDICQYSTEIAYIVVVVQPNDFVAIKFPRTPTSYNKSRNRCRCPDLDISNGPVKFYRNRERLRASWFLVEITANK